MKKLQGFYKKAVDAFPSIFWIVAVLVLGWLFGEMTREVLQRRELVRLDYWILAHSSLIQSAWLTPFMTVITKLGGHRFIWILTIAVTVLFIFKRMIFSVILLVVVVAGGWFLEGFLKAFIQRPRPIAPGGEPLIHAGGWSYPSAHAMLSMLFYMTLAYILAGKMPSKINRRILFGSAFFLVLLIAFSRIYLQVHYFSDVAAGLVAGFLWFALCLTMMEHVRKRFQ